MRQTVRISFRTLLNGVLLLIAIKISTAGVLPVLAQDTQMNSPDAMRPHTQPPSQHLPAPGKDEQPSPGPYREPEAMIPQQTTGCSAEYPAYSAGNWQYAIFRLCASVLAPQKIHIRIEVKEAQYYWGAWYYNKYPMNLVNLVINLGMPGQAIHKLERAQMDGSGKAFDFDLNSDPLSLCSANYTVKIAQGALQGMYYPDAQYAVPVPTMQVKLGDTDPGDVSLNKILSAIGNHAVLAYQFTGGFEIPLKTEKDGELCSLRQPGTLLVVQNISGPEAPSAGAPEEDSPPQLVPYALGDTHTGPANRCEMDPDAKVNDTPESAELYMPVQAWGRLGGPDFVINTNYFDVRDQRNGKTWKQTQCSVPLGVYFDNDPNGATGGTHNKPIPYLAGPGHFIDKDNNIAAVDTFFWVHKSTTKPTRNHFIMVRSPTPDSSAAIAQAKRLQSDRDLFVAFSGTALIPPHLPQLNSEAPDSGETKTTRIGVGYSQPTDRLYVFEGGEYRGGVDREELAALFRALNSEPAMEIDGGGSAALIIRDGSATWAGGARPQTSCTNSGAWCSPVTQPDHTARPVPSWLGMYFTSYRPVTGDTQQRQLVGEP